MQRNLENQVRLTRDSHFVVIKKVLSELDFCVHQLIEFEHSMLQWPQWRRSGLCDAKKLGQLPYDAALHFTEEEIVTNKYSLRLTEEQFDILKMSLERAIWPPHIGKSDILCCFNKFKTAGKQISVLWQVKHTFISILRPSNKDIKRLKILKELSSSKYFVFWKSDIENSVVCYTIVKNTTCKGLKNIWF